MRPINLLLAYYADDFTGSTDALESLTLGGVETALFVEPPSAEMLRHYPHVRAIGIAGNSRTMTPAEMDATLPRVFESLCSHRPHIVHYKVCSTFDSSPEIGSIGRAIEQGHGTFSNHFVPLVVGVPQLQRFCVFGNLFARSGLSSAPFRLDRHPTMREHPVTPMTEADLRLHLSRQTSRPIGLVDVLAMESGYETAHQQLGKLTKDIGATVLFDGLTDDHLAIAGRLIWEAQSREQKPLFAVGSSGIEYALTKHWHAAGLLPSAQRASFKNIEPADRIVVVSGSRSPVTKRQIAWALEHGFDEVRLDVASLCQSKHLDAEIAENVKQMLSVLDTGRSVILHTYRDLTDSRNGAAVRTSSSDAASGNQLGTILGRTLRDVVRARTLRRVSVVGGDTSGYVARSLGIDSLEMVAPLEPGAPVCVARGDESAVDGLEVVFKGGQVGYDDFFETLLCGRSTRSCVGAH